MFTSYGVKRAIDPLGRVTLPKEFRTALGVDCGDVVEICHTDDGILLRKTTIEMEEPKDAN